MPTINFNGVSRVVLANTEYSKAYCGNELVWSETVKVFSASLFIDPEEDDSVLYFPRVTFYGDRLGNVSKIKKIIFTSEHPENRGDTLLTINDELIESFSFGRNGLEVHLKVTVGKLLERRNLSLIEIIYSKFELHYVE